MRMNCIVYRSEARSGTYLYLSRAEDIEGLPDGLRARLGRLTEVMRLELSAQRKLAQADVQIVMARLAEQGWYLQLPPGDNRAEG
jgi:uncharacterized protein YcgL (UPF0745 family)